MDFVPFLPVIGIIIITGGFTIYICFRGVPNTPENLVASPDIEAPLLVLDSS